MTGPDLPEGGDPACWAHLVDGGRTDLATRTEVERLVRTFYRAAAMDELLGPMFEAAHVHWPDHIETVTAFWMEQLFGTRGYAGRPLRAHEAVDRVIPFRDEHFARWLALFTETVDELYEGPVAELAKSRAAKMARALQRLLRGESAAGTEPVEVAFVPGTEHGATRGPPPRPAAEVVAEGRAGAHAMPRRPRS